MQEEVTPDKFKLSFNTVINRLKKKKKKKSLLPEINQDVQMPFLRCT